MLKIVATTVLGCCGLLCSAGDAAACGGSCSCSTACCTMPMPSMQSMPGMPGMPAIPPQASAGTPYRTYSYQPAPTYSRSYSQSPARGFQNAGTKAAGKY